MRLRKSLLVLAILVFLLGGCATPSAPSTSVVSPPNPVTPPAVQPPITPSPTTTPKPSVPLALARFVLGDLTITPTAVMEGEEVTYSIQVSNIGGTDGNYTVVFKYKNTGGSIGSDNVEVTLKPGQTKTATLTTTKNESGTYFVNVNDKGSQYTVTPAPTPIRGVPATSASAITSPPPSMVGINTHTEVYGTDADPNIITLGPKLGSHPNYKTYPGKRGMEFELKHGTPLLAPIDMVLIGFSDASANYRIQEGQINTPFNDLMLWFESASPDWPGMIIFVYHLYSSPLVIGHNQNPDGSEVEEWGSTVQAQGHLFFEFDDSVTPAKGTAGACEALIGYTVKRGELIGFAGSVGTHSMAPFCFKVSDTSINPTVIKGNRYLHWVQPGSFFYWKSYSPDADFPSGVLAYPFECDGYQLPAEQHDVNFKYTSKK